jgi:hypothetical protein
MNADDGGKRAISLFLRDNDISRATEEILTSCGMSIESQRRNHKTVEGQQIEK